MKHLNSYKSYLITLNKQCFFLVLILISVNSFGQICNGNLGENIFTDGDFGRGLPNVVSQNPDIAPGYIYEIHPPPNDGEYTITNDTRKWSNIFSGWLKIYDNSPDIKGYMMVVNASYELGLFYENEIDGLCENTLYQFSADIINLINTGGNLIKPNVSFLLDDQVVYNTGNIPEDEKWNTYGFTFTTEPGQNSVKLSLRNNAEGGMGNDLALDNISFQACGPEALILPEETTNICEDGQPIVLYSTLVGSQFDTPHYQWQKSNNDGLTWVDLAGAIGANFTHSNMSSGYYYYRYLVANGYGNISNYKCRIVSNVKVIRVIPTEVSITDSICQGLTYKVGDTEYSTSGRYVNNLINSLGCDSIVILNLTIVPDSQLAVDFIINDPSCSYIEDGNVKIDTILNATEPLTFIFNDEPYSTYELINNLPSGEYSFLITDRYLCDLESTLTLQSPQEFIIDLGPDLQLELGDEIQLSPDANFTLQEVSWKPNESIYCESGCIEINWTPINSGTLSAKAISNNNCVTFDTINITVKKNRKVHMPNAFSPNNDGLNDFFNVIANIPNVKSIVRMSIYDRWGELVYENYNFQPNDHNEGWDGKFKGKYLSNGIFVYNVDIIFLDDEIINYSGSFSLIK